MLILDGSSGGQHSALLPKQTEGSHDPQQGPLNTTGAGRGCRPGVLKDGPREPWLGKVASSGDMHARSRRTCRRSAGTWQGKRGEGKEASNSGRLHVAPAPSGGREGGQRGKGP